MECAKCGNELPEQAGVGRPRKFCSTVCLKLATREVRHLDALIAKLETQESYLRINGNARYAAQVRGEIAHLEARMAEVVESDHENA